MTTFQQLTRSFGWLTIFGMGKAVFTQEEEREGSTEIVLDEQGSIAQAVRVMGNVIKLPRRLDDTYHDAVIATFARICQPESTFVLDLQETEELGVSGLFTLHGVVMMARGETPPDPDGGWQELRRVVDANLSAGRQEHLRLINLAPAVEAFLRVNHFDHILVIG